MIVKYSLTLLLMVLILAISPRGYAIPHITTEFDRNIEGFVRAKVVNQTPRVLACYLAIDGHKIKFRLPARAHSRWFKATDKRFTPKSFSTWCDYIERYPEYQKYVF